MAEGWICIARKITEWEWYSDSNVFRLFMHLLLNANFRDNKWQGMLVARGQLIASRGKISEQIGLTIKQIRLAESKLSSCGAVVVKGANKFTMYTIAKYDDYQTITADETTKGQSKGKQKTTKGQHLNNDNNDNNDNNEKTSSLPQPLPDWVPLEAWEGFKKSRGKLKAPMTEEAERLAIRDLELLKDQGYDPKAVLEQSIMRGWKGLFKLKGDDNANHRAGTRRGGNSGFPDGTAKDAGGDYQPPSKWQVAGARVLDKIERGEI